MTRRLLMSVICVSCCCAGPVAHAGWASGIAITNEAAFFNALDLTRKELVDVREAVAKEDWAAAKVAWGVYLEETIAPRWLWSYRDLDKIKAYLKARGEWAVDTDAADALLQEDARTFDGNHKAFDTLSTAYMVTRDSKYAQGYLRMMREWLAAHPVTPQDSRGSWHRLLIHQRIRAWFNAMNRLMGAPAFDAEIRYEISRALIEHARWLHRNPRNRRFRGNNIQGKMLFGLSYATLMLPEAKESEDWWDLVLLRLGQHMEKGVYPDGAHIELTPGYAGTQAKYYMDIRLLARKTGVEAPQLFERHEKMFEFSMHLGLPGGGVWKVSDCGAGFGGGDQGGSAFLATGALLYDREDLRWFGTKDVPSELIWKLPAETLESYATMPARPPAFLSHMMPYAQYATMRTGWEREDHILLFDCAPSGGPHTHCDQLQVLLYSGGRVLLGDPGTCGYKEPDRPYYISHAAHNVLLVDGKGIGRHARPEVVTWSVKPGADFAAGRAKNNGCVQQRSVLFVRPDYWVVTDHISGTKERPTIRRHFHLPDVAFDQDGRSMRTRFPEGDNLWLHAADDATLNVSDALIVSANADGRKEVKGPLAVFEGGVELPGALATVIVPFSAEKEIPTVKRLASEDGETVVLCVRFSDGRTDWIAVAPTECELTAGEFSGKGVALCGRTGEKGRKTAFEVFGVAPLDREE